MPPCTEVAIIPLKAGVNIHDENSEGGKLAAENLQTLLDQPGMQRLWWGTEEENPSVLRMFIDWDDVQKHKDFMAAPAYGPFMERFKPIMGGAPNLYHIVLDQHNPPNTLGQGVTTEVLTVDFPSGVSDATKSAANSSAAKFGAAMKAASGGPKNITVGWSLEHEIPGENGSADKGTKMVGLVGWNSVEEHMAFRDSPTFKDNIHLLRELPEQKGMSMVHVKAQVEQARGI